MVFQLLLGVSLLAAQENDVKIVNQAAWSFTRADAKNVGAGARLLVIRTEGELFKATGLVPDGRSRMQLAAYLKKAFGKDTIDFDKHILVVITAGTQPSGGFKVEATKATSDAKTLTIHWKLHEPSGAAITVLTHPGVGVLIDHFAGDVRADPPVGGKKGK
jgi:hypothetical protein